MKTLTDWKYEIAFNNDKYIDAKNYSLFLKQREKQVMDLQLEFYRVHYSFDALIGKLRIANPRRQAILLAVASKNIKNILHTPYFLKQYYINIINKEFFRYKKTLVTLLNYSIKQSTRNPIKNIYKSVFGSYLPVVKRKIKKYSKRKMQFVPFSQKLTEFDYLREIHNMEFQMAADKTSQGIFGKYMLFNTKFAYDNSFGFGTYNFGKLTHGGDDLFVLNSGNYNLSLYRLHHLVYLNLYPGKGNFINYLYSRTRTNCFDLGANYLVNGWSTFAMLHYNQNAYTRNLRVILGKVGKAFFAHNFEKALSNVYNYMLGFLPKDEALNYIILMSQYPGLIESYIFGAIATEECINKGFASSPLGLLNKYRTVNLGDFFFEYK